MSSVKARRPDTAWGSVPPGQGAVRSWGRPGWVSPRPPGRPALILAWEAASPTPRSDRGLGPVTPRPPASAPARRPVPSPPSRADAGRVGSKAQLKATPRPPSPSCMPPRLPQHPQGLLSLLSSLCLSAHPTPSGSSLTAAGWALPTRRRQPRWSVGSGALRPCPVRPLAGWAALTAPHASSSAPTPSGSAPCPCV